MSKRRAFGILGAVLGQKLKEIKLFHKIDFFLRKFKLIFRPPYSLQRASYTTQDFVSCCIPGPTFQSLGDMASSGMALQQCIVILMFFQYIVILMILMYFFHLWIGELSVTI